MVTVSGSQHTKAVPFLVWLGLQWFWYFSHLLRGFSFSSVVGDVRHIIPVKKEHTSNHNSLRFWSGVFFWFSLFSYLRLGWGFYASGDIYIGMMASTTEIHNVTHGFQNHPFPLSALSCACMFVQRLSLPLFFHRPLPIRAWGGKCKADDVGNDWPSWRFWTKTWLMAFSLVI